MTADTKVATIQIQSAHGRFVLDMPAWPERAEFSRWLVLGRPERIRLHRGHIELRLDNARAVYHIDETNVWNDSFLTTLVYSEGP